GLIATVGPARGDEASTAPSTGIAATGLGVSGAGASIGQLELGRPGSIANGDTGGFVNPVVSPAGVYLQSAGAIVNPAPINMFISPHPEGVAGIMIASGAGAPPSVAPGASLYSCALLEGPAEAILATQYIATNGFGV